MWRDKTDVTGEAGTAYTSGFSWVHVVQSLAFYVVIGQSLFLFLYFGHCIDFPSNYEF
jgi:hypothetical protein